MTAPAPEWPQEGDEVWWIDHDNEIRVGVWRPAFGVFSLFRTQAEAKAERFCRRYWHRMRDFGDTAIEGERWAPLFIVSGVRSMRIDDGIAGVTGFREWGYCIRACVWLESPEGRAWVEENRK
jgi:hypothetical protein